MRHGTVALAALALVAAAPLSAQDAPEPADAGPTGAVPDGPILVGVGTAWSDGLSPLPAPYLDGLTLRTVDRDHSLSGGETFSLRVGVRVADRWIVQAERSWTDSKFALANVDVPVRDWGGSVQYLLPGGLYVLGGVGAVRYTPDDVPENTDVRWVLGGGGWFRFSDRLWLRTEVRDDMSWFSLRDVDGRLQHRISVGGALVVSVP